MGRRLRRFLGLAAIVVTGLPLAPPAPAAASAPQATHAGAPQVAAGAPQDAAAVAAARQRAAGPWVAVATGDVHTCALRRDGTLWCWGLNLASQLADATLIRRVVT